MDHVIDRALISCAEFVEEAGQNLYVEDPPGTEWSLEQPIDRGRHAEELRSALCVVYADSSEQEAIVAKTLPK